jgi:hypothetical protein
MKNCGFLRRLAFSSIAALAIGAGVAQPAQAFGGCADRQLDQVFLRWLDLANYTLAPNGGLESGSTGWSLSRGARVVSGNERFYVRSATDRYSLSLPSGSSAKTGTTCVTIVDPPTVRFFVRNTGSLLSTLKVEALYKDIVGTPRAQTVALLVGTSSWQPTLPLPFLATLQHPPLLTDGKVDVAFRFTPLGSLSGWRIDDVYVDPFKAR